MSPSWQAPVAPVPVVMNEAVAASAPTAEYAEDAAAGPAAVVSRQAPPQAPRPLYAQASTAAPAAAEPAPAPVASDGRSGPLLIYQAELHMAVYKIEQIQQQAIAAVRELGGYVSEHTDRRRVVLRIPAGKFYTLLERVETLGEITHRFVRAQDVTARFRDLEMRLRNAEAVRDRILKLLEKAPDVKQSLLVEAELDRISERIEQMKGELKLMGDLIAYSTITIQFALKQTEHVESDFELPFPWLKSLGLQHLMSFP